MGANSKIEWTDHTFNPWRGCTKVSAGCANCYAETLSKRNPKLLGVWGKGQPRVLASDAMWKEPLRWNAEATSFMQCPSCGRRAHGADGCPEEGTELVPVRPRVFCASLADWLDDEVPIEWLARLLALVQATPNLDWLLLTKRPENWKARLDRACYDVDHAENEDRYLCNPGAWLVEWLNGSPPENVWMGTSVENQEVAEKRIPVLLGIPARVRFLSCEPLLGAVDLTHVRKPGECDCCGAGLLFNAFTGRQYCGGSCDGPEYVNKVNWVIAGGESGPGARPMHPDWVRGLRDQCEAAGVPFLFKQWGEWAPAERETVESRMPFGPERGFHIVGGHSFALWNPARSCWQYDGHPNANPLHAEEVMAKVGKVKAGRVLDGIEHNGFPGIERGSR